MLPESEYAVIVPPPVKQEPRPGLNTLRSFEYVEFDIPILYLVWELADHEYHRFIPRSVIIVAGEVEGFPSTRVRSALARIVMRKQLRWRFADEILLRGKS